MRVFSWPVFKEVFLLSYPVVVSMFSVTALLVTDTIMVGRLGKIALASAGLGGIAYWTLSSFFMGASYSVQILTARRFGEKKTREISAIFFNSLYLFLIISISSMVFFLFFLDEILKFLSIDPLVRFHGSEYLFYRSLGTLPFFLSFQLRAFFDGLGKTNVGMKASFLMTAANILFNYILIYGTDLNPAYGVKGAGMASALAAFISLFYFLYVIFAGRFSEYIQVSEKKINLDIFWDIIRLGWPPSIAEFGQNSGFMIFMKMNSLLGPASVAASNIIFSVTSIAFMPGYAFSVAATTITGQNLGARKIKMATTGVYHSFYAGAFIMIFMGGVFILFSKEILGLYTIDASVIEAAYWPLIIISVFQVGDAGNMIFAGALRGAGLVNWVMIRTVVITWLVMLPTSWFLGIFLFSSTTGLWIGTATWMLALALLNYLKFQKKEWTKIKI